MASSVEASTIAFIQRRELNDAGAVSNERPLRCSDSLSARTELRAISKRSKPRCCTERMRAAVHTASCARCQLARQPAAACSVALNSSALSPSVAASHACASSTSVRACDSGVVTLSAVVSQLRSLPSRNFTVSVVAHARCAAAASPGQRASSDGGVLSRMASPEKISGSSTVLAGAMRTCTADARTSVSTSAPPLRFCGDAPAVVAAAVAATASRPS